jgi:hypothetical protein
MFLRRNDMKVNYALCDAKVCAVLAECGRNIANHTDVDLDQEILQPNGFITHDKRCFYFFEKAIELKTMPIEETVLAPKPALAETVTATIQPTIPKQEPKPAPVPAPAPAPVKTPEPAVVVVDPNQHWKDEIEVLSNSLMAVGHHDAAIHVAEAAKLL